MNLLRPTLLTLACLMALPGHADDLPSLGDASSAIVSPQQEHQLGRAWLSLLRGQVNQLNDPQLKDYVETSVYRLAETSQLQDRRLEFILIDSKELNAFAAPGGIVGVNGGLFLNAQTEGEYASVLAHELAHLSQRHFARGVEAQQRMQLPMMAALLAGIVLAAGGGGDAGIGVIAGTQAAAIQEQRRFSRQNEQEADRIGIQTLARAGYDPNGMADFFERMQRVNRGNSGGYQLPEYLRTHPVTTTRISETRQLANRLQGANTPAPVAAPVRASLLLPGELSLAAHGGVDQTGGKGEYRKHSNIHHDAVPGSEDACKANQSGTLVLKCHIAITATRSRQWHWTCCGKSKRSSAWHTSAASLLPPAPWGVHPAQLHARCKPWKTMREANCSTATPTPSP